MSDENRTIDRRSLLKLIGATGATGAVVSACGSPFDGPVSAEGLTGGKFEKTVTLATAGPGGNKNWKAGDAVKFLPPQDIPTRGAASDALAGVWRHPTSNSMWPIGVAFACVLTLVPAFVGAGVGEMVGRRLTRRRTVATDPFVPGE